jgi:hypothetical protein
VCQPVRTQDQFELSAGEGRHSRQEVLSHVEQLVKSLGVAGCASISEREWQSLWLGGLRLAWGLLHHASAAGRLVDMAAKRLAHESPKSSQQCKPRRYSRLRRRVLTASLVAHRSLDHAGERVS